MPTFKHPPTRINKISKPMTPQRRRRLWISYGLDWILTIGVWAVFYAIDKVNGYRRLFSITDTSLHHPYAEDERIHVWHLALIAGVFPLVVILVWTGAVRRSWFDAQVGVLGLGLTLGLTVTFTNIIKVSFLVRSVNVDFASSHTPIPFSDRVSDHSRQTPSGPLGPVSTTP
jgi:hypothetical protein